MGLLGVEKGGICDFGSCWPLLWELQSLLSLLRQGGGVSCSFCPTQFQQLHMRGNHGNFEPHSWCPAYPMVEGCLLMLPNHSLFHGSAAHPSSLVETSRHSTLILLYSLSQGRLRLQGREPKRIVSVWLCTMESHPALYIIVSKPGGSERLSDLPDSHIKNGS